MIAVFLAGCGEPDPLNGRKLYPVKGKVVLADGKPLTTGRVVFAATTSSITSTATLESDGGFSFKGNSGDGLPEGEYKIRIEAGSSGAVVKGSSSRSKSDIPFASIYTDEDSSNLTATVTPDESKNNFELKLESPGSKTVKSRGR